MKHETIEQIVKAAPAVAGASVTWQLHEVNQVVALLVGLVTIAYVIVQLAYLVRKWWVQERGHRHARKTDFGTLGD